MSAGHLARRAVSLGVILSVCVAMVGAGPADAATTEPYRAFVGASYWNKPFPSWVPIDPNSQAIVDWVEADNAPGYLTIAGTGSTGSWGQPVYWVAPTDPTYRITPTRYPLPAELLDGVRIPSGARPDPTSDAEMTLYDLERGLVYHLWMARYDATADTWSAGGGAAYYVGSKGLAGNLSLSDDPRNFGHRGVPPPAYAVRYDEIVAGRIDHVLKVSVDTTKAKFVFPMVGHENGTTATFAPPEGTRIRIKPWKNLTTLGLSPAALVIATALKEYGAVIGDQSGGAAVLKVENTVAEGRGWLWNGVLNYSSLSKIPLDWFQVVKLGWTGGA